MEIPVKCLRIAIPAAAGVFAAATLMAQVITAPPLSGNFALVISGFELVTPAGSNSLYLDIKGNGLLTADGSGNLTGSETFAAASPVVPEVPGSAIAAPCGGTLAGGVTEPGDGTAQVQLKFVPLTAGPTGAGAQDACVPMAMTLSCVEIIPNFGYAVPLAGGVGVQAGAGLTADKKKNPKKKSPKGGSNAPVGGSPGPIIPIPVPIVPFISQGANSLKCVVTNVSSGSTAASIDGASLSVDMQQTGPASIIVPTPEPLPSPNPPPSPIPLPLQTPQPWPTVGPPIPYSGQPQVP